MAIDPRIEQIFDAVVDLSPSERRARLVELCDGDDTLRREIERLLASDSRADQLEGVRLAPMSGTHGLVDVGDRLDAYHLEERLGEGGMGVVFAALQERPIRRRVAVKIIKPGLDTRQVLARFETERRVLARLEHPGIARILDAGATPSGRPYFVMEWVRGEPLTDYCRNRGLDVGERIDVFLKVLRAVEHAHQKGIVHRDLKPSNLLVTEIGDEAMPKVIDFGIAKVSEGDDRITLQTEHGSLLGTLEYMSPEAADGSSDLDTRADIYSLGVILHELLLDRLPYDSQTWSAAGLTGRRQIIVERDVRRPSLDATGTKRRLLRDGLDWVLLHALEKDPAHRYATVSELALDLERFRNGDSVLAGPPRRWDRLQRIVRRHRGTAVAFVVATVAVVIALAFAWVEAARRSEQLLRMSDSVSLEEAIAETDRFWPPLPESIPAMERWLEGTAEPLLSRLPLHERTLEELRGRALPYTAERAALDRREHPERKRFEAITKERADLQRQFDENQNPIYLEHFIEFDRRLAERLDAQLEELAPRLDERWTWEFADPRARWEHHHLQDLVERLRRFGSADPRVGTVASVRERLAFAKTVAERTTTGPEVRRAWEEAIDEIESLEVYGGLVLTPQIGLVPLGRDPRSGLWEFWHIQSGARPEPSAEPDAPSRWTIAEETGLVLVLIPGGSFRMGSEKGDADAPNRDPYSESDEQPIQEVTLDPYFISKYEVTQGQWKRLTGENPSRFGFEDYSDGKESDLLRGLVHPVDSVSAEACLEWTAHNDLELPTEAQWEYAARAGSTTPWPWGSEPPCLEGYANVADLSCLRYHGDPSWGYDRDVDDGYTIRSPVDTFRPNAFGLHDVIGNVWEICGELFTDYTRPPRPGDGRRSDPPEVRWCLRGGGWETNSAVARCANRSGIFPGQRHSNSGLRPSRKIR
ncbi:MAG: SUMF1/EgtB/PvdO family nonheme iron enzyme [Planctomycetes bacterium]|nr:SUMF1/EgtB/PvdO family nonheme iron enzyme [Planctomycetota bacterium]